MVWYHNNNNTSLGELSLGEAVDALEVLELNVFVAFITFSWFLCDSKDGQKNARGSSEATEVASAPAPVQPQHTASKPTHAFFLSLSYRV